MTRDRLFLGTFHIVLGVGLLLLWFWWHDAWAMVVSIGFAGVAVEIAVRKTNENVL